jgi:hypothetical protein
MTTSRAYTPARTPDRPRRLLSARLRVELNRVSHEAGRKHGEHLRAAWREILETDLEGGASWPDLETKLQQMARELVT